MNSPPKPAPPAKPVVPREDVLPPVHAPNAAFILQLFLIPMIIVLIIVSVWLMFSWLAQMGNDPRKIASDIRSNNTASWQKALLLANMLRNPEYETLKDDAALAGELAALLEARLDASEHEERAVELRRYLCRAIGEFRVIDGAPVLLRAASQEKAESDVAVRRSALAALAVLSNNVGSEEMLKNPDVMDVLLEASRERGGSAEEERLRAPIRSTAAYTMGVIGGERAKNQLAIMLEDSNADARYNAANGLARHGDPRAVPVLIEMLDLNNKEAVRNEKSETAKQRKRFDVIINAIRCSKRLMAQQSKQQPPMDLSELRGALQAVSDASIRGVSVHAQEALNDSKTLQSSKVGS